MRTLSKPQKQKQNQQLRPKQQEKKDGKQSKKIVKTIFSSPFRYKIQALNIQDAQLVINFLINYAKALRNQFGSEVKAVKNEQLIRFKPKSTLCKPILSVPHLIYGIKQCTKKIRSKDNEIKLIVIFYDQKYEIQYLSKHDLFQQLLCSIVYYKYPYIVLRDSQKLKEQLGIKHLLCLGLRNQSFCNDISTYCCKCLIEIPWLVEDKWIPLP